MQDLRIQLCFALELDKAHCGSGGGLSNRLCVALVVLLCLDVGLDVFGGHQPYLMSLLAHHSSEMVSTAAGLHGDDARRQPCGKAHDTVSCETTAQDDPTRLIQTSDTAAVLAKINPKHRDRHQIPPLLQVTPAV